MIQNGSRIWEPQISQARKVRSMISSYQSSLSSNPIPHFYSNQSDLVSMIEQQASSIISLNERRRTASEKRLARTCWSRRCTETSAPKCTYNIGTVTQDWDHSLRLRNVSLWWIHSSVVKFFFWKCRLLTCLIKNPFELVSGCADTLTRVRQTCVLIFAHDNHEYCLLILTRSQWRRKRWQIFVPDWHR